MLQFEWHEKKAQSNLRKHQIDFDEAKSVFYDENARLIVDEEHSSNEDRFIILGMSQKLRILVVVHAYRQEDEIIRIISARKATKSEQKEYEEFL